MIEWAAAALAAASRLLSSSRFPESLTMLMALGLLRPAGEPSFLTAAEVDALPSKPADARIAYGPDECQFADLRLPNVPGPHPTAIVLHGGCWISKFADLGNTAALADALRDSGIATWNVEYRSEDVAGGGWPGTFLDAANAADHLRAIAARFSLNLNQVIAIGHSAGGHLALWLAGRPRLSFGSPLHVHDPLQLRGIVSLGGIPDLTAFREHGKTPCEGDVVAGLMGGGPEEVPERYRAGSPAELLPLGVRQVLIHGEQDETVPANFGETYAEKGRRAGDDVRVLVVPKSAHHEYNAPGTAPWPTVRASVFELLGLS